MSRDTNGWMNAFARDGHRSTGNPCYTCPVRTLVDELGLELLDELEVEVVLEGEGLLADDRLHRHHVLAKRLFGGGWGRAVG